MSLSIEPFLTAYDPSDLPGGTVDPLGFDSAYEHLAGKILPGLTNVAGRPRYHSMICAALTLCDEAGVPTMGREAVVKRADAVLRMERFWALASFRGAGGELPDNHGLRGVRYVIPASARIDDKGDRGTTANFQLLGRQATAGALGIYGAVANGLKLLDRPTLQLLDLGRELADAFLRETLAEEPKLRAKFAAAIVEGDELPLKALTSWGERAAPWVPAEARERKVLREALDANHTRQRMASLLRAHPLREGETELERLDRIARQSSTPVDHPDLFEALRALLAFETAYRCAVLVLFRVLWSCQTQEPYSVALTDAAFGAPLEATLKCLREGITRLEAAVAEASTPGFLDRRERMSDACALLRRCADAKTPAELVRSVVDRHAAVQRRRGVGGRGKLAWVEVESGRVRPTLAAAQRIYNEPTSHDDHVGPHRYRTATCDAFEMGEVAS